MIKTKSIRGPTLDTFGQFSVSFGELSHFIDDNPEQLITGNMAPGAVNIPMLNSTSGFAVGQTIVLSNSAASERRVITAITANVQLTVGVAFANAYTTASGAKVTVLSVADGTNRVAVVLQNPAQAGVTTTDVGVSWVSANAIRITGTVSGAFTQGEVVTGSVSGATGIFLAQGTGYIEVLPTAGLFVLADTVTGASSAQTVTVISRFTPLAPTVVVTTQLVTDNAGALAWALATTADVAGMEYTISADLG